MYRVFLYRKSESCFFEVVYQKALIGFVVITSLKENISFEILISFCCLNRSPDFW